MTADRIKEIQEKTDSPNSTSVYTALLKVWNECEQSAQVTELKALLNKQNAEMVRLNGEIKKLKDTLSEVKTAALNGSNDTTQPKQ
jgi:hypothetical protein